MSSYSPEDRALLPTRRIEAAWSLGFGKWGCRLECGHETVQDCDRIPAVNTDRMGCVQCLQDE